MAALEYSHEHSFTTMPFSDWCTPDRIIATTSLFSNESIVDYDDHRFQPMAVYGDDICVDHRLTPIVMSILSRLGFTVNAEKSFTGSQTFRESCGKFYQDGIDVTPLYFSLSGSAGNLSAEFVASYVSILNDARSRGFKSLWRFMHKELQLWWCPCGLRWRSETHGIPYVAEDSLDFGIRVPNPWNDHLRTREGPQMYRDAITGKQEILNYQRIEYLTWHITYDWFVESEDILSLDSYEYMRWWASRGASARISEKEISRLDTGGARLQRRWTPLY